VPLANPQKSIAFADEEQRQAVLRASQQNEQYVRGRIDKQIEALGVLASTLRAVPGRKQIVLLSEGFDPKYVRGRDARDVAGDRNDLQAIQQNQLWRVDSDARFGNTTSLKLLDEMAHLFRASDVVLHAIDILGVRAQNDISGPRINSNDALYLLATPTGGEVFKNSNDLGASFEKMLRRQEVVYVLTFYGASAKPGRFHNLAVRLIDVPGARVSHRAGYFESGAENAVSRTLTTAEIIVNDIPQHEIRLAAMAAAFPSGGDGAQVPVIVEMNGADLLRGVRAAQTVAEIFVYAFDEEGLVRDRLYQRMSLDLAKVGERLRAGGIKYYATLSLPPGRYAVKSLVKLTDSERRGFARTDLVVPKGGELALAPFFIDERPGDWLLVKGMSHDPGAAYPFAIAGEALVPSAAGRSHGGTRCKLAVIVHNARPDELTVSTAPPSKVLRSVAAGEATQLVIEVDSAVAQLDVTVQKKSAVVAARVMLQ